MSANQPFSVDVNNPKTALQQIATEVNRINAALAIQQHDVIAWGLVSPTGTGTYYAPFTAPGSSIFAVRDRKYSRLSASATATGGGANTLVAGVVDTVSGIALISVTLSQPGGGRVEGSSTTILAKAGTIKANTENYSYVITITAGTFENISTEAIYELFNPYLGQPAQ